MKVINVKLPSVDNLFNSLSAGDKVLLSGKIYTARDQAHKLLAKLIANNQPLPLPLSNSIIYYTGPIIDTRTGVMNSAGPTTSSRMDSLTATLLQAGVRGFIGKGPRSEEVTKLFAVHKALYFLTIGGAGVYLAQRIKKNRIIAFPHLQSEAIYELIVEDFPCYVAIDSKGNSIL